jgi:hypothetical protein
LNWGFKELVWFKNTIAILAPPPPPTTIVGKEENRNMNNATRRVCKNFWI